MVVGGGWVGQPITDPISGPSFDFSFTIGPELDKMEFDLWAVTKISWATHPITFRRSEWEYMVQIEALSTSDSQGGQ